MAETETTEADVAEMEAAQQESERFALGLEQQLTAGDLSITAEQLDAARSEKRFAILRLQGVRAKLAEAREAKRQTAAADLRAEIDSYASDFGSRQVRLLEDYFKAVDAFVEAGAAYDARIDSWRQRASELGIPAVAGDLRTRPGDSGIGLGRLGIEILIVGRRRLSGFHPKEFLMRVQQSTAPASSWIEALQRVDAEGAA